MQEETHCNTVASSAANNILQCWQASGSDSTATSRFEAVHAKHRIKTFYNTVSTYLHS